METKLEIQQVINILQDEPKALNAKIDTQKIIIWLTWLLRFIDLYNKTYQNKKGEYRKPGLARAWAFISAVFALGLELIKKQ